jgi:hypothetical protein
MRVLKIALAGNDGQLPNIAAPLGEGGGAGDGAGEGAGEGEGEGEGEGTCEGEGPGAGAGPPPVVPVTPSVPAPPQAISIMLAISARTVTLRTELVNLVRGPVTSITQRITFMTRRVASTASDGDAPHRCNRRAKVEPINSGDGSAELIQAAPPAAAERQTRRPSV